MQTSGCLNTTENAGALCAASMLLRLSPGSDKPFVILILVFYCLSNIGMQTLRGIVCFNSYNKLGQP